jgi:hypothetical protein
MPQRGHHSVLSPNYTHILKYGWTTSWKLQMIFGVCIGKMNQQLNLHNFF